MKYARWNVLVAGIVALGWWATAQEYALPLRANTGFFERRDELLTATLDLARPLDLARAVLRNGNGEAVPFWFEPGEAGAGRLHWILAGEVDSLRDVPFELRAAAGPWPAEPVGEAAVAEAVRRKRNLLPNGGFEQVCRQEQSTTWKGERGSADWELHDFAWANRLLPDPKASARLADEQRADGEMALRLISETRPDATGATAEKPVVVAPYVYGPTVPLRPGVRYRLSYRLRIAEVARPGYLSVSLEFLDADRKRIFPRNYAINRLQVAYGTSRHPEADYLNRWVTVAGSKETLPMVRFGRIALGMGFAGTCYVDSFCLRETDGTEPVAVTVGPLEARKEQ